MLILLIATCMAFGSHAQMEVPEFGDVCAQGSCYPATGDLLVGRAHRLTASSTCGLQQPERYCIVSHLQEEQNCFVCDSRQPGDSDSHTIKTVVTTFTPNRLVTWWQSENGLENVTIQLDLEAEFHFTHLIMTFKTFRPAAMVIERSMDSGKSWQVYRYYAHDCNRAFPGIPEGPIKRVDDIICDSRYSDVEPSTQGEVIFRVLDPAFEIPDPYSVQIQNLLKITNIRVRMLKLHTLGDNLLDIREEVRHKYYYALYEMVVRGNCFCYGHASKCAPSNQNEEDVEGMVHGFCVCNHYTTGLNCEKCQDFYHDHPWKPALGPNTNACKRCECNHHAYACHFDMAAYMSTGNVSGGVCDECQHNTMGRQCELCKPFFYQHPERHIRDPNICEPCSCDPRGSLNGGLCDGVTDVLAGLIAGQCRCKRNVEGERCGQCRPGHFGLSETPEGCQQCTCSSLGTVPGSNPCDPNSGSCFCKRLVMGQNCDQCRPQHWGLSDSMDGCRPCDCDQGGAVNNDCNPQTGQCVCREHMFGRRCDEIESGYYFIAMDHYTYEAEKAKFGPAVSVIQRPYPVDREPTWTGVGFARVPEGEELQFTINNIPESMDYDLLIRYEPQLPAEWERAVVRVDRPVLEGPRCADTTTDQQTVTLPPGSRHVPLLEPICFEEGQNFTVHLSLPFYSSQSDHQDPFIFIDSIVLMPHTRALEMFAESDADWDTFERYRCQERSQSVVKTQMTHICRDYIFSMSALLHQGAMKCVCDPHGSRSTVCEPNGGQCQCRTNVMGRSCDRCVPSHFLYPNCRPCECDPQGSVTQFCEDATGQCECVPGAYGRQCAHCLPSHWGFPHCQPCQCNGHSQFCDAHTGECQGCRGNTAGHNCERCDDGFYGNALLEVGSQCRPCLCPDGPGSSRQFAVGCYEDLYTQRVTCACSQGYTGPRCEQCAPGYYGNPEVPGGQCLPCECNGNIDLLDPGSCDAHTGACLKCLHYTEGSGCQYCKRGYYGDAKTQDCRKCMCNERGTSSQGCTGDECVCDEYSGQCPCLPSVVGQHCDQCAIDTWNYDSGEGCQACLCHPVHSYGSSCDQLTGQCTCQPGFGGRTCEECRELFWGNPEVQCHGCDCDPRGISSEQCNKRTGDCACLDGYAGHRCDSCARGFSGTFPDCVRCHQCFSEWDATVGELTNQTRRLLQTVEDARVGGVVAPYKDLIDSIEESASELKAILEHDPVTAPLEDTQKRLQEATELVAYLSRSLNVTELTLEVLSEEHNRTGAKLEELEVEAAKLHQTVRDVQDQVEQVKNSNIRGASDSITKYYHQSIEAEQRADSATSGPLSAVEESAALRQTTEDMMNRTKEEFDLKQEQQTKQLEELANEIETLDLSALSITACGAGSEDGSCGTCGGLGCVTEDGAPHCGGEGCGDVNSVVQEGVNAAKNFDKEIIKALQEVDKLNRMVSEARGRADVAKLSAQDVLLKANQSKERVELNNQELRGLIQQIRDFLRNSTDLETIEALSNEVLAMSMPASAAQLDELTNEIRERVKSLTGVEEILERSHGDVTQARTLLQDAKTASDDATEMKNTADMLNTWLNQTEETQIVTQDGIKEASADIKATQDLQATLDSETASAELKLNNGTQWLVGMERDLSLIKARTQETVNTAQHTQRNTDYVSQDVAQTKQELDSEVMQRYSTMQSVMQQKAGNVIEGRQKAKELQEEAKQMLDHAVASLQKLRELERSYVVNQQTLEEKAQILAGLEKAAQDLLQEISHKVTVYSICL
ncbi:laminin subunit beta-1b [Sardina pilchardus]|uniref:laminin subunit beta-1b n=1 Tax=Sardina pilchardus TaxID=27697 RepID=UPI002E1078F8